MMIIFCTFFVFSNWVYANALDCGLRTIVDNDLKNAIATCLAKDVTQNDVHDFSNIPPEEETTSPRSVEKNTGNNSLPISVMKNRRARSTPPMKFNSQTAGEPTINSPQVETEATALEPFSQEQKCLLKCILSKMGLSNEEGFPEQEKILEKLTKNANKRELKDFLKDTTENCYQRMREDPSKNSCDFSTELVKCLGDSAQSNCVDWPAGAFPH